MGLVPTTIIPPRAAQSLLHRPALERLTAPIGRSRVATICAPAGSGKTNAMLFWAEQLRAEGRPVLWLSVRTGIAGKAGLKRAIKAAGLAAGLAWNGLETGAADEQWLAALAETSSPRPVLIIDDVDLLPPDVLDFVGQIIASARDSLTLLLASRGGVGVPLARMRALGFLVEVGAADLNFTLSEASELITRIVGSPIDAADLQQMVRDTEGWAAGIVIASELYARERTQGQRQRATVTGLRHEFADYFHEEVVSIQPDTIRSFLIDTSILSELTPAACAAVLGDDDARAMLDKVFEAGLFLNAIDRERSCYAYHRLFREMVLGRLMDRAPARAAELHRRASRHFAAAGELLKALEHAAASNDQAFLADQLELLAEDLTYRGYLYRVDDLGADLPWTILSERPRLLLALAWRRTRRLAFSSAKRMIEAAEARRQVLLADGSLSSYEADQLRRLVRHRQIMLDAARDDMVAVEQHAAELLNDFGDDQAYLSCTLLAQLMAARRELYHFHDILKLEAETRRALGRPGSNFASIALKASVAPTLMAQGKTQCARRFLEEALVLARSLQGNGSGLAALPALPLAELLYEEGDLAQAQELVEGHLAAVRQWGFADQLASGYLVRARLASAEGNHASALAGLEEAHLVAIECGLTRLRAFVVAEQVRILLKSSHIEDAEAAFLAGDPQLHGEPVPTLNPSRRNESTAIAWLRLEMQRHRLVRAANVAHRWLDFVKRAGATRSVVTFELLLAEIAVLQGNRSEARRAVRTAVELAEPAGWTRVFIDEGEVIASLLTEAYANGPAVDTPADRFAARLVLLMQGGQAIEDDEDEGEYGLGSRLVSREIDILTMVSGGLRNREIGDRLGLTEGTVKWYMQQIYDKLGVRRRPQAVIRARQLGILA